MIKPKLRCLFAVAILLAVLFLLSGCEKQESRREEMREEIFEYVLKNKDTLDHNGGLYVCYDTIGEPDGWVEFGYLYIPCFADASVRNGCGFGPVSTDKSAVIYYYDRGVRRDFSDYWAYREQISGHWCYYEIHPY